MDLDDSRVISLINQVLAQYQRVRPERVFYTNVRDDVFEVVSQDEFLTKYWGINSEQVANGPDLYGFVQCFSNSIIGITKYYYACVGDIRQRQYELLKDVALRDKVADTAIEEIKLYRLIRLYDGSYYPSYFGVINYAIHSVVIYILTQWQNIAYILDVGDMLGNLPNTILLAMRSILSAVEHGDIPSGYALLRTLMERFFIYDVLDNNPQKMRVFHKFQVYREEYYSSGSCKKARKHPEEVISNYTESQYKQDAFYDLGFLDEIDPSEGRKGKYTFSRLIKCTRCLKGKNKEIEKWFQAYNRCSNYVHGSYTIKDTYQYDYIWILARVGELLMYLVSDLKQVIGMTFDQSGIDLENYLKQAVEGANKLYQMSLDADKENKEKGLQNPPL